MSKKEAISVVAVIALLAIGAGPWLKLHMESVNCGNKMASIGYAARLFANDHEGRFPSDFLSMADELSSPFFLVCPSDRTHSTVTNWEAFNTNNTTYEIVASGLNDTDTNAVFLRCKIHRHLGYVDGTVFDGTRRRGKASW